ncbi:MAG: IS5 family transposase [Gammaproteobacteria bacterium AqS3]|nr:IS5 family transposase [Gammaproteobacteria bacterium AqS3]
MRGEENPQPQMFSCVDLESRVPKHHPIRKVRRIVDTALSELAPVFDEMYADKGRRSIPPEQLLRALLLQIFFSIRSERLLVERIDYDLLFRWFVGLGMDDPVWNHSTFSKDRDRLMSSDVDELLFEAIKKQAYARQLMSRDHFSVDGTLIEACASLKSFRPKDDSGDDDGENFHGQKRKNETHQSSTDPDAKLYRKSLGKEAKLCFMGHVLTENRNGLIVAASVTEAGTKQEWLAGSDMLSTQPIRPGQTVGADKGCDVGAFVTSCRELGFTPHVASKARYSRLDGRTTRHEGYKISQKKRKRVEEPFGWMKTYGLLAKLRHRGKENVDWLFRLTATAYNITRMKGLMA